MNERLEERGWKFEVWFMARSESERHWNIEESDFGFRHRFLRGKSLSLGSTTIYWHTEIRKELREAQPDILVVAGAWVHPTVLLASLSSATARLIFWSESHLQSIRHTGFLTGLARRSMLSRFSEFAVPGQLAKQYIDHHSRQARIFNLPNLVDPAVFHDRVSAERQLASKEQHSNRRVLLIVARLSKEKGLLHFLEGINKLSLSHQLTLLIAGSGDQRPDIERWIRAHDVDIRLLGEQPQRRLTKLYAEADGFALPSLSDPNPISVIEALWAGLPLLLSSRVGSHPECLRDNKNGFLFDPCAPQSIGTAVSHWLALSPAQLKNFGEYSLQIARNSFDPDKVVSTFLNELLEAPKAHLERRSRSTARVG